MDRDRLKIQILPSGKPREAGRTMMTLVKWYHRAHGGGVGCWQTTPVRFPRVCSDTINYRILRAIISVPEPQGHRRVGHMPRLCRSGGTGAGAE